MDPRPAPPRRPRRVRWIVAGTALLLLALLAWIAAGPWLAVRGIERAVAARDTAALARHVDFPKLGLLLVHFRVKVRHFGRYPPLHIDKALQQSGFAQSSINLFRLHPQNFIFHHQLVA